MSDSQSRKLLCLGVGQVASTYSQLTVYGSKYATTRKPEKAAQLSAYGMEPIALAGGSMKGLEAAAEGADVLVSFPPDGESDKLLSACVRNHRKLVYISSTVVYGAHQGEVDNSTDVDETDERARLRLSAEEVWRGIGASIIRAPGLYGPKSGLHLRLRNGNFRIPGDGSNHTSRIHLYDLAHMIDAAFGLATPSTFLAGDLLPATLREVVTWLCQRMSIPYPDSIPISEAHYTLVNDRRVMVEPDLTRLGVVLNFPTYREGFAQCLNASASDITYGAK